mmetsp:Transcript_8010/g.7949  ORF Transcript_8010/g.7949 Transcript_8010/m.7949 type:complete len:295 (-) Transcript_8010:2130-3014(-)
MTSTTRNTDYYTLNNGENIPAVGIGTWKATKKEGAHTAVKIALQTGYRHIDTAVMYDNEEEIGKGIKESGVPREDIFVTTKLWNTDHKQVSKALDTSLQKLGLDYVDLYIMHWPLSIDPETEKPYEDWNYIDTYREMQNLVKSDKVKSIGISNCNIEQTKKILDNKDITIKPVINQVESHPLFPQLELFDFLKENDMMLEAYSPLGSDNSPLFKNDTIIGIAQKYDVSLAQVLVSWAIQRGSIVLPKSVTETRIISNLKTFKLKEDDFATLNNLSEEVGPVRTNDPDWFDFSKV